MSRKRAKDKPWITSVLKSSIKEKHQLYRRLLLNQTEVNKTIYKVYKNKLKTTLRQAEIIITETFSMIKNVMYNKCGNI